MYTCLCRCVCVYVRVHVHYTRVWYMPRKVQLCPRMQVNEESTRFWVFFFLTLYFIATGFHTRLDTLHFGYIVSKIVPFYFWVGEVSSLHKC